MELEFSRRLTENEVTVRVKESLRILNKTSYRLNDPECEVLVPILRRLIRGFKSGTENSRKGFYSTLIGLYSLVETPSILFDEVINLVETELSCTNTSSREEEERLLFGTILIYGSFIHANIIVNETKENQKLIVERLLDLSNKYVSLKTVCYYFINQLLSKSSQEFFYGVIKRLLKKDIEKSKNCCSLDQLYCLFIAQQRFNSTKLIKIVTGTNELINENSMQSIINALMNVPASSFISHPFYNAFCSLLVLNEHLLNLYWKHITHRLKDGTHIQEYIVLQLLYMILDNLPKDLTKNVPSLMRKHLINLILNNNYAHRDLIKKILERLEICIHHADSDVKLSMIKKLLFYPGVLNFDCLSGSRIVKAITNSLDSQGVVLLSDMYSDVLLGRMPKKCLFKNINGSTVEWSNKEIRLVGILYGRLLLHTSCYNNIEWRKAELIKLIDFGFFNTNEDVSEDCAGILRSIFFSTINHKFPRLQDHISVLTAVVNKIEENINNEVPTQIIFPPKVLKDWKYAKKILMELSSVDEKNNLQHRNAFQAIILFMALMLWKDPGASQDSLQELYTIMDKTLSKNTKEEPHWSDVLVDLLLQLLSSNNNIYRNVVRCVFKDVCTELTENGVKQILKVLGPEFRFEDLSNEEVGNISNSEFCNNKQEDEADNCSNSSGNISDDAENIKSFTASLSNIAPNSDNESVDMDHVDEDEGELLNMALSQIFKTQIAMKSKKKINFEDRLTHFRIRVLDFIEILFENGPTLKIVLDVLPTLFDLLENCIRMKKQEGLYSKLRSCFSKLSNVKKYSDSEEVDDIMIQKLRNLLNKGNRSTPVLIAMTPQIVDSYKYFFRISSHTSNNDPITNILLDELHSLYEKRNSTLVFNIIKTAISMSWEGVIFLMPHITKLAFSEDVKFHKKYDIILLLDSFFKNARFFNNDMLAKYAAEFDIIKDIMNTQAIEVLQRIVNGEVLIKFDTGLLDIICTLYKSKYINLDWDSIKTFILESIPSCPLVKKVKKMLNKLCLLLKVDISKAGALEAEATHENTLKNSNTELMTNTPNAGKRKRKDKSHVNKKSKAG